LGPEFYWARVFELPLNSIKNVKPVLPSLFDEFIDIDGYSFFAIPLSKNRYLCFAYHELDILDMIKQSNLSLNQISNIYFAQIEFLDLFTKGIDFVKIQEKYFSYVDDILVSIPSVLDINIEKDTDINSIKLSKNKISISSQSKFIDKKTSYILIGLFFVLSSLTLMKYYVTQNIINDIPVKINKIKKDQNLPSTSIQIRSIINKLEKTKKTQLALRDAFSYIFDLKNIEHITIDSIDLNNKKFTLKFKNTNNIKIINYFKKRFKNVEQSSRHDILTIGFKYE
jgi:hypothetical protein